VVELLGKAVVVDATQRGLVDLHATQFSLERLVAQLVHLLDAVFGLAASVLP
jgi:hypothetical protein